MMPSDKMMRVQPAAKREQSCTCGAQMTWRTCDWCNGTGWVDGVGYCAECDANGGWWKCDSAQGVRHGESA
jgi:hypothetical protein